MTELQEAEVLRTASEAQRKRNYAFRHPDDPAAVLSDLGLMQTGQLTNGADVLFAANPSRRLPKRAVRLRHSFGQGRRLCEQWAV